MISAVGGTQAYALPRPDSFSFCDLSSQGLPSMHGSRSNAPVLLDGKITEGEYGRCNFARWNEGIRLLSLGGQYDNGDLAPLFGLDLEGVLQENYLSFDNRYFYLGVRLLLPDMDMIGSYQHPKAGAVYLISVSLGLTPGEDPVERSSCLTNRYFFSADGLDCIALSGTRMINWGEGESELVLSFSSFTTEDQNIGYTDFDGLLWNSDRYRKEAVLTQEMTEGKCLVTFEARIPIGDVLLSVEPARRDQISLTLKTGKGQICGSFFTQISVTDCVPGNGGLTTPLCISTGIAGNSPCPFSDSGESWSCVIRNSHINSEGLICTVDYLPTPIYLVGGPSKVDWQEGSGTDSTVPPSEGIAGEGSLSASPDSELRKEDISQGETGGDAYTGGDRFLEDLPPLGEELPEHTEIIYLDRDESGKEDGEMSLLGSILTLGAGVFLFFSVVGVSVLLRLREKQDEKNKKTTK